MSTKSLEDRQTEMKIRMAMPKVALTTEPVTLPIPPEAPESPKTDEPFVVPEIHRKTLSRHQLYSLVWTESIVKAAKRFGISDRGLAKYCVAANIPLPERGYWAKLSAGKKVARTPLPPRGLGQSDEVTVGASRWSYSRGPEIDYLNEPIPPVPVFEVDMETIRAQVTTMVSRAPLPKTMDRPHPQIAKLLAIDEERAQKHQASKFPSSWDAPIFNNAFETRRLRILNSLFVCLEHCGMKAFASGKEGRNLSVLVGDRRLSFSLDTAGADRQLEREQTGYAFLARNPKDKMRLSFTSGRSPRQDARSWQDSDGDRLENHLRDIAIELIVSGEQSYRDGLVRSREFRIEYKAELQEQERQRKIEEERERRKREVKLEQQRVDHLLGQADAMHRAGRIRAYVTAIHEANKTAPEPMTVEELNAWTQWALVQADRIDPVMSGAYRTQPIQAKE